MRHDGDITYSDTRDIRREVVVPLYIANGWSSADKPGLLHAALLHSHSLVSAWQNSTLVGIGNAISDGQLVVYYPHLLVLPSLHRRGIGQEIMRRLMARYTGFHQQMLVADVGSIRFYESCGFTRAGKTEPMWIYDGNEH